MAELMNDSIANPPAVPTMGLSLQDIEMPAPPGVDWDFWLTTFGWSALGLLVIVLLLWLGRRYYLPLQLSLQLQRLQKSALKSAGDTKVIGKSELWRLYGWATRIQRHLAKSEAETAVMETFMQHLNQLGFSQNDVPRETYLQLLEQARELLQKSTRFKLNRPVHSDMLNKDR